MITDYTKKEGDRSDEGASGALPGAGPALVDAHIHFWDHDVEDVSWQWLRPGFNDGVDYPVIGRIDSIKSTRYGPDEFKRDADDVPVTKVVHVQAAVGTADPVAETRWLETEARRTSLPHAIVAYADIRARELPAVLDAHGLASTRFRGIRDLQTQHLLDDSLLDRALVEVGRRGLVLDLDCAYSNMEQAYHVAARHPDVTIVLDHAGSPIDRSPHYFHEWRRAITRLAAAENVYCKISGLGMADHEWTVDSIRPWVAHCLDQFGTRRCMVASNWPIDRLYGSYKTLYDAYLTVSADCNSGERTALFSSNAERVFSI